MACIFNYEYIFIARVIIICASSLLLPRPHTLFSCAIYYTNFKRVNAYQTGSGTALSRAFYGQGTGSIWLDGVGCVGNELRLWDCTNDGIGIHNCFHSEDASVQCSTGLFCGHQRICNYIGQCPAKSPFWIVFQVFKFFHFL